MAQPHVVDKGIMHIAAQNDEVPGCTGVLEYVQHDIGRPGVRHPVFRVDHQRPPGVGKQALHSLDQLDTEHRRRGDHHHGRFMDQFLLQIAERLPVHQPGRPPGARLRPPAVRARIQNHQFRLARQ